MADLGNVGLQESLESVSDTLPHVVGTDLGNLGFNEGSLEYVSDTLPHVVGKSLGTAGLIERVEILAYPDGSVPRAVEFDPVLYALYHYYADHG